MNPFIADIAQTNTSSSIQQNQQAEASGPTHAQGRVLSSPESQAEEWADTSVSARELRERREAGESGESRETHRLGKIARLPRHIRQQLNERLADNEPSEDLLNWLNGLPEVQTVLQRLFEGRPITKQNVSTWRLGGFRDWERAQEARTRARAYLEEAEEVAEELEGDAIWAGPGCPPFLDRVSDRIALGLLELFHEAEASEKGPRRTREMLEIARELARLRRGDHQQRRLAVHQERWMEEQDVATEERDRRDEAEAETMQRQAREMKARERISLEAYAVMFREDYLEALASGRMTPEKEKATRTFFEKMGPRMAEFGIPGLPEGKELKAAVAAMRAVLKRKAEEEAAEETRWTIKRRRSQSKRGKAANREGEMFHAKDAKDAK